MKIRKRLIVVAVLAVLMFLSGTDQGLCKAIEDVKLDFHGQVHTQAIVRDRTGVEFGFFDDNVWEQWRTQLKFDISLIPDYGANDCTVKVRQVFLSYRGAYDAIYDLTSRYNGLPDSRRNGGSRYDLGLDDMRTENDLREAFIDIGTKIGDATLNSRLGRQITQWGEADFFNIVNVVNPQDLRGFGAFANPDELANPIWMGRFDFNSGPVGMFENTSIQLLLIPDNRPTIYGPSSPTAGGPFNAIFIPGVDVRQNDEASQLSNMQVGVRLGVVKDYLQAYFYGFSGYQNATALNFSQIGIGKLYIDHPKYKMVGFSFNYNDEQVTKGVWKGEFAYTDAAPYMDFGPDGGANGYSMHKVFQGLIGFSKALHPTFIGTDSALGSSYELYYTNISNWDYDAAVRSGAKKDNWRVTATFNTDYLHGSIAPVLALAYDFEGVALISPTVTYTPDGYWFASLSASMWVGKTDAVVNLAPLINSSDATIKFGYRW
jgi:hypothetical protein